MKVKTSVTLSEETLEALDSACPQPRKRSELVEAFIVAGLKRMERDARRQHEIDTLNAIAEGRRGEIPDAMEYGISWEELGSDSDDQAG